MTFVDALRGETSYDWFDGQRDDLVRAALTEAASTLEERFDGADPGDWLEPTHKSRFLSLGASARTEMDMRNRASYNQLLDVADWTADDEATWTAAARDVMPPGNDGLLTAADIARLQATGEEPDRLTDQQGLYVDNDYKPHPATRRQVEAVTVEATTIRTAGVGATGPADPPTGVPADALKTLGEALENPFETGTGE